MSDCQSCDKKAKHIVRYKDIAFSGNDISIYEAHLCSDCCEKFKEQGNTQKLPIILSEQKISL